MGFHHDFSRIEEKKLWSVIFAVKAALKFVVSPEVMAKGQSCLRLKMFPLSVAFIAEKVV